jgi:acyl-CoA thioesterase
MGKTFVSVDIDGQNLNARHYAAMEFETAISKMQADFESGHKPNEDWCEAAYVRCKEAVEAQDAKDKAAAEKKAARK